MATRKSSKAKQEAQIAEQAIAVLEAPDGEVVEGDGTTEIHPAIAKIKAKRAIEPSVMAGVEAIEPSAPTETFKFQEYEFEYYTSPLGLCRPVLKRKGDILFSGWLCKDRDSAKSLIIAIYYQLSGTLKGTKSAIKPEMLATHPLSALIYQDDNTAELEAVIAEDGNKTELYPVVVNPYGLALSGNTRLTVVERQAKKTGIEQLVHVVITDGADDVGIIVGGNVQRVKTAQDYMHEAIAMTKRAARKAVGKFNFQTEVRNAFIQLSGTSGGIHDATKAVMRFVKANPDSEIARRINKVGEQNPTVALELVKIQQATKAKDGTDLPADRAAANVAQEINKMARLKSAKPIEIEKVYPGIDLDLATIRIHYQGETVPVMAEFLSRCTPEMRAKVVEAKRNGDKRKLSILKEAIEAEQSQPDDKQPDWNAENDADEANATPAPEVDPQKPYYTKMRQMGIPEDYTWIMNRATAAALNEAIGGRGDVDPFAEPTGHLQVDRRILATDRPVNLEDWGGGTHQSEAGLRVVTALPPSEALIPTFTTVMERIENGTIAEACFIADISVLMLSKFTPYFKSIPFAYVVVERTSNADAAEGFGFEPSPYLLSNPRFAHKTAADWNESTRGYVILYYGTEYDRFDQACGKFGTLLFNAKAAAKKAMHFDWLADSKGNLSASNDGIEYAIEEIAGTFFLLIDDIRQEGNYKKVEHAQKAAVIESLGI